MTNQQGAPEALRLADWLQNAVATYSQVSEDEPGGYCQEVDQVMDEAAAELRRLHAENERLAALVEAQQPAPSAAVVVQKIDRGFRWDGEKQQHIPTLLIEFEPVPANSPCDAKGWQDRDALADLLSPTPQADSQPATLAAVASKAVLAAIRAANMQLVQTGDDEFMLVKYKNAEAQCDGGKCGIGGYCEQCPAARAPADSVLEDADPLQGAANWLAEAHGQFCVAVLQGSLMIGYNRAKRLHDAAIAARKQGGAT